MFYPEEEVPRRTYLTVKILGGLGAVQLATLLRDVWLIPTDVALAGGEPFRSLAWSSTTFTLAMVAGLVLYPAMILRILFSSRRLYPSGWLVGLLLTVFVISFCILTGSAMGMISFTDGLSTLPGSKFADEPWAVMFLANIGVWTGTFMTAIYTIDPLALNRTKFRNHPRAGSSAS